MEGTLSAEGKSDVHRHIRACPACRELVAKLASSLLPRGQSLDAIDDPSVRALALSWSSGFPLSEPSAKWEPPVQIDEYRIERLLGSGSMGRVYLGHDARLDRPVAIKFLAAVEPDAAAYERFLIESRAIARLHHPNVATCYRAGESSGRPYLVSEFVQGTVLDRLPKPIPWQQALAIGLSLARGLAAAHARGVLHRDIKPANVILSNDGEAKLLDFGLAKLTTNPSEGAVVSSDSLAPVTALDAAQVATQGSASSVRRASAIVGTPVYMATEIWRGEEATTRSDVYSLGALLYELCSGHPPHQAQTTAELRQLVLTGIPAKLSEAHVPPRFSEIIAQALDRQPVKRFADGEAIRVALEQLSNGKVHRPRVVRPALAVLVGIAALAVVAGTISLLRFWRAPQAKFRITLQGVPANLEVPDSEREIGISLVGVPRNAVDLRITVEVDGQRTRAWRPATASSIKPISLRLPTSSPGQKLKVEILAYSQQCSVAVGRGAIEWWQAEDPRQLTGTFETCDGCWCAEHPPVGHRHIGIWADSEDAVWLVGENAPIQRYDGLSWVDETPGQSHWLVTVWGLGPDKLWAVGGCGNPKKSCPYPKGQQSNIVMRRRNGTWTKDVSFGDELGQFLVIWATDENDVWAAGSQGETKKTWGIIAHRDGDRWTELPEGRRLGSSLHGIWGADKNDVWLVGEQNVDVNGDDPQQKIKKIREGVLWHHTGGSASSWVRANLSPALGRMPPFWGVWGTGSNNVWVIGNRGVILNWDGSDWKAARTPFTPDYQPDLANIWIESLDAMWIVGDSGSLVRWKESLRRWVPVEVRVPFCEKATGTLYGIWSGGKDVWVTGECGTVYHYRSR